MVQRAFEDRSEADYEDDATLDAEALRRRMADIAELIELVKADVEHNQPPAGLRPAAPDDKPDPT